MVSHSRYGNLKSEETPSRSHCQCLRRLRGETAQQLGKATDGCCHGSAVIMQCMKNHDTAPGGLRDRQFDDVDHGDHSQARGTQEYTHSMRCPHAGTVQVHAVWTCMKQACACIACTMLHGPRSVRMLRSSVSPTAHVSHACSCAAPKFRRIQRQFLRSGVVLCIQIRAGSTCGSVWSLPR